MKRPTLQVSVAMRRGTREERNAIALRNVGRPTSFRRAFEFSDADIEAIWATMPCAEDCKAEWLDRLRFSVDIYLASWETQLNQIRNEIKRLNEAVSSLLAFLEEPATDAEKRLRAEMFRFLFDASYDGADASEGEGRRAAGLLRWTFLDKRALESARDLEYVARVALDALGKPERGAPKNIRSRRLGEALARSWEKFTDMDTGYSKAWQDGPYARHAAAVLAAIPENKRPAFDWLARKSTGRKSIKKTGR